jgi:hypothetical protein
MWSLDSAINIIAAAPCIDLNFSPLPSNLTDEKRTAGVHAVVMYPENFCLNLDQPRARAISPPSPAALPPGIVDEHVTINFEAKRDYIRNSIWI